MKKLRKKEPTLAKRKGSDFFDMAKKQLSSEQLQRAHSKALAEIFSIRLGQLREQQGFTQNDVKGFTQSNVSRLEARDDMKLSTLIEYLQSINMDVEITVNPKDGGSHRPPIKLLKTG